MRKISAVALSSDNAELVRHDIAHVQFDDGRLIYPGDHDRSTAANRFYSVIQAIGPADAFKAHVRFTDILKKPF